MDLRLLRARIPLRLSWPTSTQISRLTPARFCYDLIHHPATEISNYQKGMAY